MKEKWIILNLLIESYYINIKWMEGRVFVWPPEFVEKVKKQIEKSTGLKITEVLKVKEQHIKENKNKIIDRKADKCSLTFRGFLAKLNNKKKELLLGNGNIKSRVQTGKKKNIVE